MKKYLLIPLFIFFFSQTAFAGWVDSGANVYFTGGNAGINTTSPTEPLDIRGTGGLLLLYNNSNGGFEFGTGSNLGYISSATSTSALGFGINGNFANFYISTSGLVGIQNTTPAYDLDVTGDINFTGDLYQNGSLVTFGDTLLSPQMEYALQFFGLFFIFLSLIKFIVQLSRYLL